MDIPWKKKVIFITLLPPLHHSSSKPLSLQLLTAVYKRALKGWIRAPQLLEPGLQINTETKDWPRKLSLQINKAGDGRLVCPSRTGFLSVCVCSVADSGLVSPSGNAWCFIWGCVFSVTQRGQTDTHLCTDINLHREGAVHRRGAYSFCLLCFVMGRTCRRTVRSNNCSTGD